MEVFPPLNVTQGSGCKCLSKFEILLMDFRIKINMGRVLKFWREIPPMFRVAL